MAGERIIDRARIAIRLRLFFFGLLAKLDDLAATIVAVRSDVVTPMGLAGARIDGQRRPFQRIVRATHIAARW
jgi:hypothetical protein